MKTHIVRIFSLFISFFFILSCSEDEKQFTASPDLLMTPRQTNTIIELASSNATQKEELTKKIENYLAEDGKQYLVQGLLYEMKLDGDKSFVVYKSSKDLNKGKSYKKGAYAFDDNVEIVSYTVEGEVRTFTIVGSFASAFYNHFVRKNGSGKYHEIDKNMMVFCLHENYTEEIKEKYQNDYPEVEIQQVEIATDMQSLRTLQTFK